VLRVSATVYLGSFLARARFLPLASLKTCLRLVNRFMRSYAESFEDVRTRVNVDKYAVFYGAVQAIIYVFCFRWRELMLREDGSYLHQQFPPELHGFQNMLMSKFAPLRVSVSLCALSCAVKFSLTARSHSPRTYITGVLRKHHL
jgi:RNA polymerase I-specific transcription initiation factor RRN3